MKLRAGLYLAVFMFVAAGAAAQPAQQATSAATATGAKTLDPNEMICERQREVGSRLATKRVCMTRGQWADLKSQDRQEIERVQTQRGQIAKP